MDQAVHPVSTGARISLGVMAAFAGIYVIWGTTYLAIAFAVRSMPPFISGVARFALAGGLMYAWLRAAQSAPVRRREHPDDGAHRHAAVRHGQRLRDLGAARHSERYRGADGRRRADARAHLRLGVLQQARADEAGAVRHRSGDRRRGDDRDAHARAVRQRASAVPAVHGRGDHRLEHRHAGAEALGNSCHGAQLHLRPDAVRRSISAADVDRDRRVGALRSRGDHARRP